MRILVLGAGAIGGYFGGRLVESGADVTFLVRERRSAALAARGLMVKSPIGDIALPVKTIAAGTIAAPFDLVLLSCKAYDLEDAMATIAPALGRESVVLPLLNGMRHLDRLSERFGAGRVLGGACYIGVTLDAAGVIQHGGEMQSLIFGELDGERTARVEALAALFARTKVAATIAADIRQAMWEKLVMLAALAATTTLTRATVGEIVAVPGGETFMLDALTECERIAAAEDHPSSAPARARAKSLLTARGSSFAASMMRDLVAGGATEGDHIIGDLVHRAERHGRLVPILSAAYCNLAIHEARRRATPA